MMELHGMQILNIDLLIMIMINNGLLFRTKDLWTGWKTQLFKASKKHMDTYNKILFQEHIQLKYKTTGIAMYLGVRSILGWQL